MAKEQSNSFKFSTFIFIVLGVFVPLWPISLPLFWYLAYRSYKGGGEAGPSISDLKNAKDLLDSGVINQSEFDAIKAKAIN